MLGCFSHILPEMSDHYIHSFFFSFGQCEDGNERKEREGAEKKLEKRTLQQKTHDKTKSNRLVQKN